LSGEEAWEEPSSHDGAKRLVGRKRHIAVDGRLLMVGISTADIAR